MSESRWAHHNHRCEPQALQAADVAVVVLNFFQQIALVTANTLGIAEGLLKCHANAKRDSSEFAGSVQMGLDSLTTEEKP